MTPLVSPQWLADHRQAVIILDATLLDPALGRDARTEYEAGHIAGARFLDLKTLVDPASTLPNTLPSPGDLAARLAGLGVSDGDAVVLYDDSPWKTAARAWWMLRAAGWRQVAILDGGMAAWKAAGLPLEAGAARPDPGAVTPQPIIGAVGMAELDPAARQIVDARSAARFTGEEGDPHGAAPGHIPGSRNLPYARLFDADGRWKQGQALSAAFADAGVDPARPITVTCGSGITACVIAFGAHLLGQDDVRLYDGSWSEWGRHPDTQKAVGPA